MSANFNPRTPCGVRPCPKLAEKSSGHISIHAPRAGCDHRLGGDQSMAAEISIHAPRAGCDPCEIQGGKVQRHFNPRTPCGVRRLIPPSKKRVEPISIHAPRAGCDPVCGHNFHNLVRFQSTHPVRGATAAGSGPRAEKVDFNPRTPCGVRRPVAGLRSLFSSDFNPRTPCGVRRALIWISWWPVRFQSTHPVRGATNTATAFPPLSSTFQSTHPVRGATRPFSSVSWSV